MAIDFRFRRVLPILGAAALISSPSKTQAALITPPYTQNFDSSAVGTNLPADFTETDVATAGGTADASIALVSAGNNALQMATSASGASVSASSFAALQLVAGSIPATIGSTFNFTADMRITSASGAISTETSLYGLESGANFSTANGYRLSYVVSGTGVGQVGISENGTSSGFTPTVAVGTVPVSTTSTYHLKLTGTYVSATQISLSGSISDGTSTSSITAVDTSAETGAFFGTGTSSSTTASATGSLTTQYDNVAIPEPASLGLVGLASCGLLAGRRRRVR